MTYLVTLVGIACYSGNSVQLTLEEGTDLPIVEAKVNGRPVRVLIDTGATSVVLSSSLMGVQDGIIQKIDSICFQKLCFNNVEVLFKDSAFSNTGEIQGIVGMDILRRLVVGLYHLKNVSLSYGNRLCKGKEIQMHEMGGRMFVDIVLNQSLVKDVLIDTGAAFSLLNKEVAEGLREDLSPREEGAGGCSFIECKSDYFRSLIESYCIGSVCSKEVEVKYPVWNAVGNSFLKNYDVMLDFSSRKLVFCGE